MALRIVHFSDLHFGELPWKSGWHFDKRWIGGLNHFFTRRKKCEAENLDWLAGYIAGSRPDLVVCTGDLSATGGWHEVSVARKALERILEVSPAFAFVPGNHDRYTDNRRDFAAFEALVREINGSVGPSEMPVMVTRGGVELVMVNMTRPSSWGRPSTFLLSNGEMTEDGWQRLEALLAKPRTPGVSRLLVGHFPLCRANGQPLERKRRLENWQRLEARLPGCADALLTGHIHRGFVCELPGGILQSCAGSLTLHGDFCELDIDNGGKIRCTLKNRRKEE